MPRRNCGRLHQDLLFLVPPRCQKQEGEWGKRQQRRFGCDVEDQVCALASTSPPLPTTVFDGTTVFNGRKTKLRSEVLTSWLNAACDDQTERFNNRQSEKILTLYSFLRHNRSLGFAVTLVH